MAVLAVILFHAGFIRFRGGYTGVDVFFVISGFLITGILLRERTAGTFTLARFYERRARRILPALLVVLMTTFVGASQVMFSSDLRLASRSLVSVLLFSSNILFWQGTDFADISRVNYFGRKLEDQPLIHTWSLGIEEQFYLLFPIAVLLVWRFRRSAVLPVMVLSGMASLALSDWWARVHPVAAFYLLPSRGWELLLGGLVAFSVGGRRPSLGSRSSWLPQLIAGAGIVLVVYSIVAFDKMTPFPGLYALAPTLGTAMILWAGDGTIVGALLSSRPLVGIGLISYSAYLWHQPLFALARYVTVDGDVSTTESVALCALTLALAFVTWHWVETPLRDRTRWSRRDVLSAIGVGTVLLLIPSVVVGFDRRAGMRSPVASNVVTQSVLSLVSDCDIGTTSGRGLDIGCLLDPASSAAPVFLVVGDSHADAMFPAFARISQRSGLQGRLVSHNDCSPLQDVTTAPTGTAACLEMRARTVAMVRQRKIPSVFLVARWSQALHETLVQRLTRTIDAYAAAGAHVYIVEQVPEQPRFARRRYLRAVLTGQWLGRDPTGVIIGQSVTRQEHEATQRVVTATFASLSGDRRVTLIDLTPAMCDGERCVLGTSREPYYADKNHLNALGATFVSDALERLAFDSPHS